MVLTISNLKDEFNKDNVIMVDSDEEESVTLRPQKLGNNHSPYLGLKVG